MKKFFKNKWVKRAIILLIVAAVAFGGFKFFAGQDEVEETEAIQTGVVTRMDITNIVSGSGTIEAYETYNIVPTVTGDIVECNVEEGEYVQEDQILYKFDTETRDNAISKAENSVENALLSLEQAQENVDDLVVTAPAQGVVNNLSLVLGDNAGGTVCTVTDNTYMIAQIPVTSSYVSAISEGDKVTVGLEKYMTTLTGVVDRKTTGVQAGANGAMVTVVDIRVDNPGSVLEGTMASATFHTATGDIDGAEAAALKYSDAAKANAGTSGTVVKLNVKNGDWVDKGDVIAVLENKQVTNQLKTAKMNYTDALSNLADTRKLAEDYTLKAPISGKVMEKKYKKGDTVAGNGSTTLMVLADTSKMKFTINVDELDVAKISIGQEVDITADAIEGVEFKGVIETVSLLGSASNGVTFYPIVVVIDEPGDLLPGMNVSAEIIAESAQGVIAVPSGAVSYYDGKYYVTAVGEMDVEMRDVPEGFEKPEGGFEMPTGEAPTGEFESGDGMPEGFERGNEMPEGLERGEERPQRSERADAMPMGSAKPASSRNSKQEPQVGQTMYEQPLRIEVTTGVTDGDYTEIVSGDVKEGMIVQVTGSSNESNGGGMMMGMPMGGGGAPMMGGGRR